jgi:hypothetical protein
MELIRRMSWTPPGLVALSSALVAWVLYDATSVLETLRLAAVVDEASVALLGLALGLASIAVGIALWRRARLGTATADAL